MLVTDAMREGIRAVRRSKRLLGLVALVDALVALPAAAYVLVAVNRAAAHRVDSVELAQRLDEDFLGELRAVSEPGFESNLAALVLASLVLFFVVRPLIRGGYVAVAASSKRVRFDQFVRVGGRFYWKFFRLQAIAMVVMALLLAAARPLLVQIDESAGDLASEAGTIQYRQWAEAVVALFLWIAATVYDYVRVGMVMYLRKGVLQEMFRSLLFVAQHSLAAIGLAVAAIALELGVIRLFAWLLPKVDGGYLITSAVMLVLVLMLTALREASHLFHTAGAWHIRAEEERRPQFERRAAELRADDGDLLSNVPWNDAA